jgi:2'-5' RNA ligase
MRPGPARTLDRPRPGELDFVTAAAHGPFSGAVGALLPAAGEAERLALDGYEPAGSLHVTLAWLGDVDDGPQPASTFDETVDAVRQWVAGSDPIVADAFAVGVFNPDGYDDSRDPATVLLVQGDELAAAREAVVETVGDASTFPVWFPHLTLGYDAPPLAGDDLTARVGPVTFDRLQVAYGSEQTVEIPLASDGEDDDEEDTMSARVRVEVPETFARERSPTPLATDDEEEREEAMQTDDDPDDEEERDPLPSNRWEGVLLVEGTLTGDARLFEPGAIRWDDPPLPLRWAREDEGEHRGAIVVGRILEVWRDGDLIRGRGDLNFDIPEAVDLARLMRDDGDGPTVDGVSADLDEVDVEIRVDQDLFEAGIPDPERPVLDEEGREVVVSFDAFEEVMVTTDARLRAATVVDLPAFVETRLRLVEPDADAIVGDALRAYATETLQFPCPKPFDSHSECVDRMSQEDTIDDPDAFCQAWATACGETALVASAEPAPPADWFADPALDVPTPLTVADDGRVYGHLATWGTCHTAFSECVEPPASASGYRYFHVGAVRCDDGSEVPTGRLTLDTMHAGRRLSASNALAHYENTGLAVADVRAGEDAHGIWIAGALRPDVDGDTARKLRASPPSGDWRRIGGSLELIAALAVNTPGFPVPRAMVASGHVTALQSAGALAPASEPDGLDEDEVAMLRRMARREIAAARVRAAEAGAARRRVLVASAASRMRRE